MRIEEQHLDVLQNIEFVVAQKYRACPQMTDYAVLRVYEALIDLYAGENIGRAPRAWNPTDQEQELFEATKEMCEWWLGRKPDLFTGSEETQSPPRDIDLETMLLCLKRLRRSVQKWTKRSGRQGYLQFMSQFVQ
jgi:DNA-binding HxlR family transcriptional regulator